MRRGRNREQECAVLERWIVCTCNVRRVVVVGGDFESGQWRRDCESGGVFSLVGWLQDWRWEPVAARKRTSGRVPAASSKGESRLRHLFLTLNLGFEDGGVGSVGVDKFVDSQLQFACE